MGGKEEEKEEKTTANFNCKISTYWPITEKPFIVNAAKKNETNVDLDLFAQPNGRYQKSNNTNVITKTKQK